MKRPLSAKSPDPTDKHVGDRVRMRRKMIKVSQTKLGEAVGVTFQQLQKYEKGTNRVSASRLQQIAQALKVPVSFFFEDPLKPGVEASAKRDKPPDYVSEFLTSTDGLALTKAFTRIKDAKVRRAIVKLVEEIADRED
jgi:transcriptional regulator with XRE-family HTH domain